MLNKLAGPPLPGATVRTGTLSTLTNSIGQFTIETNMGRELSFRNTGVKPFTLKVQTAGPFFIEMEESELQMAEVVVTGY